MRRQLLGPKHTPQTILNTMVQGTAAAGLKHALLLCDERGYMPYIGAVVHDEIVAIVPDALVDGVFAGIKKCMIDGMYEVLEYRVNVEGKAAQTWG
jgi:DNA polymerase I-like protein with 3'-5' exonuclease and polymerase domains